MRPGDTVLHGFGLSMFLAGVPVVRALERMGARPVPVGAEAGSERILRVAELVRPRALACTPVLRDSTWASRPRSCSGGPQTSSGSRSSSAPASPAPACRRCAPRLQQAFGAKVYDLLGGAHGVMCCSCDAEPYAGMHVLGEDCAITTQLVDQETKAADPARPRARPASV